MPNVAFLAILADVGVGTTKTMRDCNTTSTFLTSASFFVQRESWFTFTSNTGIKFNKRQESSLFITTNTELSLHARTASSMDISTRNTSGSNEFRSRRIINILIISIFTDLTRFAITSSTT